MRLRGRVARDHMGMDVPLMGMDVPCLSKERRDEDGAPLISYILAARLFIQ